MKPLPLGIVSDEITQDFGEAVALGTSWGITRYEIRVLTTGRVPDVDPGEWLRVRETAKKQGVTITALSPGVFKYPLSAAAELEHELADVLPRTLTMAREAGVPLIIIFGVKREENDRPEDRAKAVVLMQRAAKLAAEAGVRLAIENEPGFWCDTGVNTLDIIRAVNSPWLGANWDPCNAYGTTETPYPEGYEAIKSAIVNVHVKDTKRGALIACVPVGDGVIDWKGQLAALMRDNLVSHLTIETHCLPLKENSRRNVETLRRLMDEVMHSSH